MIGKTLGPYQVLEPLGICDHYFGKARQARGSHRVYKTPWHGDPRVIIQNSKGYAKAYQVRQICKAIERLEAERGTGT